MPPVNERTSRRQPLDDVDENHPEVQALIAKVNRLSDAEYDQWFARRFANPNRIEQEAFRSSVMVHKSMAAVQRLRGNAKNTIDRYKGRDEEKVKAAEVFRYKLGTEQNELLKTINKLGLKGEDDATNHPNARKRALHRVNQMLLKGIPVSPKMYRRFIDEEIQKDKERIARQKAERLANKRAREARRNARRAAQGKPPRRQYGP